MSKNNGPADVEKMPRLMGQLILAKISKNIGWAQEYLIWVNNGWAHNI
jgi:hypothetical protein